MSSNNSNQKFKIFYKNLNQIPKTPVQQPPCQIYSDYKQHNNQYNFNLQTQTSVRKNNDLNQVEPNKPRSSSQVQYPLKPINNLYTKIYEQPYNKGGFQHLNFQQSAFIKDNESQSISCQEYVVQNNHVDGNSQNFGQQYQNQLKPNNLIDNRSKNTINLNQYPINQECLNNQYPINQQCLNNQYPINQQCFNNYQTNNFECNSYQNGSASQFNCQNKKQYEIQHCPTENLCIKSQRHQQIVEVNMPQKEIEQFQQDNEFESTQDLTQSLTKSISYQCKRCDTKIFSEIIQLDCYHFYHSQCFKEYLLQQIQASTYRPIRCYCKKRISESMVKNVLKLNQNSDLIDKLQKSEVNSIYKMYQKINNLQKCRFCNFFWFASRKDEAENTYFCQQCEKIYSMNVLQ